MAIRPECQRVTNTDGGFPHRDREVFGGSINTHGVRFRRKRYHTLTVMDRLERENLWSRHHIYIYIDIDCPIKYGVFLSKNPLAPIHRCRGSSGNDTVQLTLSSFFFCPQNPWKTRCSLHEWFSHVWKPILTKKWVKNFYHPWLARVYIYTAYVFIVMTGGCCKWHCFTYITVDYCRISYPHASAYPLELRYTLQMLPIKASTKSGLTLLQKSKWLWEGTNKPRHGAFH